MKKMTAIFENEKSINNFILELEDEIVLNSFEKDYCYGYWHLNAKFNDDRDYMIACSLAIQNGGSID